MRTSFRDTQVDPALPAVLADGGHETFSSCVGWPGSDGEHRQAAERELAQVKETQTALQAALDADKGEREKRMDALAKALGLKPNEEPPSPESWPRNWPRCSAPLTQRKSVRQPQRHAPRTCSGRPRWSVPCCGPRPVSTPTGSPCSTRARSWPRCPGWTLWVPETSSMSRDQPIFVDEASDASPSSDSVLLKIDRLG